MSAPALLEDAAIAAALAGLPGWSRDGRCICATFRTTGWKSTMMVANAIAALAECAWHHPELVLRYAEVTVRLETHDAGGVTGRDIDLARAIAALFDQKMPPGHALLAP